MRGDGDQAQEFDKLYAEKFAKMTKLLEEARKAYESSEGLL